MNKLQKWYGQHAHRSEISPTNKFFIYILYLSIAMTFP